MERAVTEEVSASLELIAPPLHGTCILSCSRRQSHYEPEINHAKGQCGHELTHPAAFMLCCRGYAGAAPHSVLTCRSPGLMSFCHASFAASMLVVVLSLLVAPSGGAQFRSPEHTENHHCLEAVPLLVMQPSSLQGQNDSRPSRAIAERAKRQ